MRWSFTLLLLLAVAGCSRGSPWNLHISPSPWHAGTTETCGIHCRRERMFAKFPPGSCVHGTFISADIQVLAQRDIRVRPSAEFWPHNGFKPGAVSPWDIDPAAIREALVGVPQPLAQDILARVGRTSNFNVYYSGRDLIRKFGFKACGRTGPRVSASEFF